jgi:hypothetical protein
VLVPAQELSQSKGKEVTLPEPRIGISGGLGVSYVNATDIVDRLNGSGIFTEKVSSFTGAAEFFGALSVPLTPDWVVKLEYAYLIGSYNVPTIFPGSEFSISLHMPTLVGQYVLVDKGIYNVKGGVGVGYHFGSYYERYQIAETTFTGSGPAFKLDLEANTAFGESFYAYLGVDIRFDFVGPLEGNQPQSGNGVAPTLDFFSAGAKLGFTVYL